MLEAMRRQSRGTIIYVLFGILIAVFVINFGPGSRGCSGAIASSYATVVSGVKVSEPEFRLYYIAKIGNRFAPQVARQYRMKEILMDRVIERELLAQEAERRGFRVSTREAEDVIKTGKMILLGREEPWADVAEGFDYKRLRALAENQFGVSVAKFIEIQQRELLADKMRQLMAGAVKVAPSEARDLYDQRERQVNLEFVRFAPRQFESAGDVTPEEVAAYQKAHADELKKVYNERSFLYKKLDRQARVRRILIAVGKDEADADKVAKAQRKADKVKHQLEGASPRPFAAVAKEVSDDEATKGRGGDMGWHKKGYLGLGDELDKKVFDAKAGDVIGPERTDKGFELLKVEGFREGDIPFEQVAAELAEDKLRTDGASERAKAAATKAMTRIKGEGATLESLFAKKTEGEATEAAKEGGDKKAAADEKKPAQQVEETGLFSRRGELIPQLGLSPELMQKAFDLKQGQVAGPFDVSGTWVLVQVKERKEPDLGWFDKHQEEEMRSLERQKWADVLDGWTKQRCAEVHADGRIKWNPEVLSYETPGDTNYTPCAGRQP